MQMIVVVLCLRLFELCTYIKIQNKFDDKFKILSKSQKYGVRVQNLKKLQ